MASRSIFPYLKCNGNSIFFWKCVFTNKCEMKRHYLKMSFLRSIIVTFVPWCVHNHGAWFTKQEQLLFSVVRKCIGPNFLLTSENTNFLTETQKINAIWSCTHYLWCREPDTFYGLELSNNLLSSLHYRIQIVFFCLPSHVKDNQTNTFLPANRNNIKFNKRNSIWCLKQETVTIATTPENRKSNSMPWQYLSKK